MHKLISAPVCKTEEPFSCRHELSPAKPWSCDNPGHLCPSCG